MLLPMTKSTQTIVMQRVYAIHKMRLFALPLSAALVLVLSLWGVGKQVWVAKVFENMPALSDIPAVLSFYTGAFLGTDLSVQVLFLLTIGAFALLMHSALRTFSATLRFA